MERTSDTITTAEGDATTDSRFLGTPNPWNIFIINTGDGETCTAEQLQNTFQFNSYWRFLGRTKEEFYIEAFPGNGNMADIFIIIFGGRFGGRFWSLKWKHRSHRQWLALISSSSYSEDDLEDGFKRSIEHIRNYARYIHHHIWR